MKSGSPHGPMGVFSLAQLGLLLIVAGLAANVLMGLLPPGLLPTSGISAAAQGFAFGRGLVTVVSVSVGVVLIIIHFAKGKRR